MKNKLVFTAGMAAGYVLGSRAGRGSYEKIKTKATELWNDPKVQEKVSSTTESVRTKAPAVQEKLTGALKRDKSSDSSGSGSGSGSASGSPTVPVVTSTGTGEGTGGTTTGGSGGAGGTNGTGPGGGDPEQVDITPFLNQDDETRPPL
ncbi:hypothetical protein [Arthrobacter sp. H41]|uniref:hypothetical protein n=1 Tax=Arthrobacter sp. H41 TaxID=1312978 RepID=UPI0004AEF00D|nr:hypothetical protein [Arthrobacter sp. H41]